MPGTVHERVSEKEAHVGNESVCAQERMRACACVRVRPCARACTRAKACTTDRESRPAHERALGAPAWPPGPRGSRVSSRLRRCAAAPSAT
eukprot:6214773-Pleurochrysis_carterae.AAC.1